MQTTPISSPTGSASTSSSSGMSHPSHSLSSPPFHSAFDRLKALESQQTHSQPQLFTSSSKAGTITTNATTTTILPEHSNPTPTSSSSPSTLLFTDREKHSHQQQQHQYHQLHQQQHQQQQHNQHYGASPITPRSPATQPFLPPTDLASFIGAWLLRTWQQNPESTSSSSSTPPSPSPSSDFINPNPIITTPTISNSPAFLPTPVTPSSASSIQQQHQNQNQLPITTFDHLLGPHTPPALAQHVQSMSRFVGDLLKATAISLSIVLLGMKFVERLRVRRRDAFERYEAAVLEAMEKANSANGDGDVTMGGDGNGGTASGTAAADLSVEAVVFVAALMVAMKSPNGCCNTFTNTTWSKVSRIPLPLLNAMEIDLCLHLRFELWVKESDYLKWLQTIEHSVLEFKQACAAAAAAKASMKASSAMAGPQSPANYMTTPANSPVDFLPTPVISPITRQHHLPQGTHMGTPSTPHYYARRFSLPNPRLLHPVMDHARPSPQAGGYPSFVSLAAANNATPISTPSSVFGFPSPAFPPTPTTPTAFAMASTSTSSASSLYAPHTAASLASQGAQRSALSFGQNGQGHYNHGHGQYNNSHMHQQQPHTQKPVMDSYSNSSAYIPVSSSGYGGMSTPPSIDAATTIPYNHHPHQQQQHHHHTEQTPDQVDLHPQLSQLPQRRLSSGRHQYHSTMAPYHPYRTTSIASSVSGSPASVVSSAHLSTLGTPNPSIATTTTTSSASSASQFTFPHGQLHLRPSAAYKSSAHVSKHRKSHSWSHVGFNGNTNTGFGLSQHHYNHSLSMSTSSSSSSMSTSSSISLSRNSSVMSSSSGSIPSLISSNPSTPTTLTPITSASSSPATTNMNSNYNGQQHQQIYYHHNYYNHNVHAPSPLQHSQQQGHEQPHPLSVANIVQPQPKQQPVYHSVVSNDELKQSQSQHSVLYNPITSSFGGSGCGVAPAAEVLTLNQQQQAFYHPVVNGNGNLKQVERERMQMQVVVEECESGNDSHVGDDGYEVQGGRRLSVLESKWMPLNGFVAASAVGM
ncbi:hypothetical protein HDU76_005862 [Blyttiomyces sp. JEL0837]|nr:hypothetical protein HDU76_005862 [Blyttiomyces sp. JEL0837]